MAKAIIEEWDTASNREAEGSSGLTKNTHVIDRDKTFDDPSPPTSGGDSVEEKGEDDLKMQTSEVMNLMRSAYSQGVNYQTTVLQPRWTTAYSAWNNKHSGDSKYSSARFRGRTKLFRPKTRSTARKKSAEAAAALFSTSDAVIVSSPNTGDKMQMASAEIIHELLNFRLDRASENACIPWFMISMGAHLNAQQTSVCISKQYWEYKTEQDGWKDEPIILTPEQMGIEAQPPAMPPMPMPEPPQGDLSGLMEGINGAPPPPPAMNGMQMPMAPMMQPPPPPEPIILGYKKVPNIKVVRDRPRIRLYPPEDVIRDPGAAWEDQAQDSSYLILRNSMSLVEAREFLKNNTDKSALKFTPVDDAVLKASVGNSDDSGTAANTRRAREQSGNDRLKDQSVDSEYATIWLHENFMRLEGKDYVFWTLGTKTLVSNIVRVQAAYPEQGGARPIVIGVGALEPFKIDPMSSIESWQPLQQEINDVVNLRLDVMKQTIAPLTIVRRGRSVDIRAIQNRSVDSVAYVQDIEDVKFDRPGDVGQSAYVEMERLNADFDDQAGNFSLGSVQTNRALGETVGGMKMMSGQSNAMGEFDLRVWVETWVEPTLRQVVKLEQYYESDTNVLATAKNKVKLFQRFGIDEITDEMLTSQVTVACNVGLGSADPMMALNKLGQAFQLAGGLVGPALQQRVKADEIIDEVFGKAGYKDAAERFFNPDADGDPRLAEAKQIIEQMQGALGEAEKGLNDKEADRANQLQIAQVKQQPAPPPPPPPVDPIEEANAMEELEHKRTLRAIEVEKKNIELQQAQTKLDSMILDDDLKGELGHGELQLKRDREVEGPKAEAQKKTDDVNAAIAQMGELIAQGQQQLQQLIAQGQQQMMKMQQMMLEMQSSNNQQLVAAMTAPKTVTTPDGRTYTSETGRLN